MNEAQFDTIEQIREFLVGTADVVRSGRIAADDHLVQCLYVWKTDKAWAGTCRQLILNFNDGTIQRANFKFTK